MRILAMVALATMVGLAGPARAEDLVFHYEAGKHYDHLKPFDGKPWSEQLAYCTALKAIAMKRAKDAGETEEARKRDEEANHWVVLAARRVAKDRGLDGDAALALVKPRMNYYRSLLTQGLAKYPDKVTGLIAQLDLDCYATEEVYTPFAAPPATPKAP